jgi:hypothetical protein
MEALEWFVIGGIIVAAADQIIAKTPWSSNNLIQLALTGLKAIFQHLGRREPPCKARGG